MSGGLPTYETPVQREGEASATFNQRVEMAMRWRLVLGRFADDNLGYDHLKDLAAAEGEGPGEELQAMLVEAHSLDAPLEYIYDREYSERSHRSAAPTGPNTFSVPAWLGRVRKLFPHEAAQIIQQDALTRYGMTELVTDAEILRSSEPTEDLLRAIIQFKHMMKGDVLDAARDIVRVVVDAIAEKLLRECRPALLGVTDRRREHPPVRSFKNVDWRRTINRNLRNWDSGRDRLVVERISYHHRQRNKKSYRIIVAVDQSGSMTDSLIHSAVMAAIFASLPSVSVNLVLWDHRVFDVTHLADDPMEVLMSCQLGGGTLMLPAMQYCAGLISEPEKTIFVLLSDWFLFQEAKSCLAMAHELHEAGVTCLGLNALDLNSAPVHDEAFAKELAGRGWFVASLTPKALAEHVGKLLA
jgi:hypothetical protein